MKEAPKRPRIEVVTDKMVYQSVFSTLAPDVRHLYYGMLPREQWSGLMPSSQVLAQMFTTVAIPESAARLHLVADSESREIKKYACTMCRKR